MVIGSPAADPVGGIYQRNIQSAQLHDFKRNPKCLTPSKILVTMPPTSLIALSAMLLTSPNPLGVDAGAAATVLACANTTMRAVPTEAVNFIVIKVSVSS